MMKCDGYIGSRIRQYRMLAKLTQKELAQRCRISESAIRNYELGNRLPDEETLKIIALALEINYYALKQPEPSTLAGALNTLYLLESMYGLAPELENGEVKFVFKNRPAYAVPYITADDINDFKELIKIWIDTKEDLIGADFDESTSRESLLDYLIWTSKFPMSPIEVEEFREAHPEIYEDPEYVPLYKNLTE